MPRPANSIAILDERHAKQGFEADAFHTCLQRLLRFVTSSNVLIALVLVYQNSL